MRLARIDAGNGPRLAELIEGGFRPPRVRSSGGLPRLQGEVAASDARLLAPTVPTKVACIGRNYAAHAAELGNDVPPRPLLFLKPPSSVIGPGEAIRLPPDSGRVEHEAELGVVIGTRCRHVLPDDVGSVILGFVCVNDVTARDLQRADKQFTRGKGFDTFCPVGPWIDTAFDWRDAAVRCRVERDGAWQVRQDGRTSLMMFDLPTLVATVSRIMTLEPGDILATGTPAGVGPLLAGDVVEVDIEGLGALRNPVEADPAVPTLGPPVGA